MMGLYSDWLANNCDLLLHSLGNGLIVLDDELNIEFMNKRAEELFDCDATKVLKKSLSRVVNGSLAIKLIERIGLNETFRFSFRDKEIIHKSILMNVEDKSIGSIHLFMDITCQKQIEQELTVAAERVGDLESIIQNSYDGIYITDYTGRTLMINKSHERITGIKATDLINRNMKDIVDEGLVSTSITDIVVNGKAPITVKQTVSNGKKVIITGNPIFDQYGNVKRVVTNVRDITELIELEKQLASTKEIVNIYKKKLFEEAFSDNIICDSTKFRETMELARKVSGKDSTVLILGETGVGKEVVARYIYKNSKRKDGNYIKINCGAIPANLLESELFGYAKGAFTGASQSGKIGMFELASGGTIFLDEIGELPLNLQTSLLRVIQEGIITRVGDTKERKVDVRIIAATNRDLEKMISENTFRSDLFYRLNVVSIRVPPLRDRLDDIEGLAELVIKGLNKKYNEKKVITSNFIDMLRSRNWPGNVREMENYIEKQFVISEGDILDTDYHFMDESVSNNGTQITINGIMPLNDAVKKVEEILIKKAIQQGGTTYKAAEILGTSQSTLFRKYKELVEEDLTEKKQTEKED